MSHIFISYSRRDLDFAQKIVDALTGKGLTIWIDWKSIPKGEDWEQEIYQGIEGAEAFLFLISPDSVASGMCNKEIAHAVKNGKRILPIFISKVDKREVYGITDKFPDIKQKDEINRRNFIFCRDGLDDFDTGIGEIQTTIQTDYEWLEYHTRLQVKAVEWERSKKDASRFLVLLPGRLRTTIVERDKTKKDNSRLLRGKELREAEEQFSKIGIDTEPLPTDLQKLYLTTSRKREKNIRQWVIGTITATALVVLGLLAWPYLSRERALPGNWVTIPEGKFTMGMDQKEAETAYSLCTEEASDTEKEKCAPLETLLSWSGMMENVELPEFSILENEVTNAQYQQCIDSDYCASPAEWKYEENGANKPATGLNWFQAGEYCTWLGGRLPTEIEWEKAASGPDGTNNYFPWGDTWDPKKANLKQSGIGSMQSIAQYADSDISYYGVKNLAGNAREWTASESRQLDAMLASINLVLELENKDEYYPVTVRGGAWINEPSAGMTSTRGTDGSIMSRPTLGFRCVCPAGRTCISPWNWRWVWLGKY